MQDFKKYLNPLYKDIDQVQNFSDVKYKNDQEKIEYPYLEHITKINVKSIEWLLPRLERLTQDLEDQIHIVEQETGDDAAAAKSIYNQILQEIQLTVNRINKDLIKVDSPYFGKIIFTPNDTPTKKDMNIYIGKFAVTDKKTRIPLVVDWRAPIANLYYQNSGPTKKVHFEAPVGKRKGELKEKKQFEISRSRIQNIYNATTGNSAADAFLLSQLNSRLGKKLADIVSTIQEQQNEIIRGKINKPAIIQGVAGSGKTTILLHRLAYLFFNYKDEILPEKSLIVAPNRMFLDYISDVLPNLGVHGINTQTYLFWGKKVLNWDNRFNISTEKENIKHKEYKGSTKFLQFLDTYFNDFEESLLEDIPYSRSDRISRRYFELKESFPHISMEERLNLAIDYAFAQNQFRTKQTGSYDDTFNIQNEKKKKILSYTKKNLNPYRLYKNIFTKKLVPKDICTYTLKGLRAKSAHRYFRMEDLAPIVYLQLKIQGTKDFEQQYIVIDECQDLSHIEISTLASIAKNGNILLAGDLAQSIIPPFYIRDWDTVKDLLKNLGHSDISYHQLNRCYRTTIEIIEFANKIFRDRFPKSYKLPEAVLRHGDPIRNIVLTKELKDIKTDELKTFLSTIQQEFAKGAVTCALICKDKQHARAVYDKIKPFEELIGREITDFSENDYHNGLLVLPVSRAKGLEFDSVVILDLNEERYPDTEYNTRLLYVAITRTLHRLIIVKNKSIKDSPLLDT
ncbi:AAA family ATPase [bacterium]|nr:AAA family ATPase [bacterium]